MARRQEGKTAFNHLAFLPSSNLFDSVLAT